MKSKIRIFIAILSLFAILSCKKEVENTELVEPTTEELANEVMNSADSLSNVINEGVESDLKEMDCDQTLSDYEHFMTEYIEFMNKYKKNPTDPSFLVDYQRLMTESNEWTTKIGSCAKDPAFASKFSAIQIKIANNIAN